MLFRSGEEQKGEGQKRGLRLNKIDHHREKKESPVSEYISYVPLVIAFVYKRDLLINTVRTPTPFGVSMRSASDFRTRPN